MEEQTISLLDQIRRVAKSREILQSLAEQKKESMDKWTTENSLLLGDIDAIMQELTENETYLRELTIKAYKETGSKQPAPGVGIREITKLEYDPKEALKWAMAHQIALSLDKKSFEGFAKATPLDFVGVIIEPQATIATDLSKVL